MKRPTMLIVEDNSDHLELTLTTLQENGAEHHIVVARDGPEALDYLLCEGPHRGRDPEDQPELVLLDLGLPGMDGLEVMRQMRGDPRTFFIPVVLLTSANERSKAVRDLKGGLNSYLSKPLDYRDFQEKLEQVRQYWHNSGLAPLTR